MLHSLAPKARAQHGVNGSEDIGEENRPPLRQVPSEAVPPVVLPDAEMTLRPDGVDVRMAESEDKTPPIFGTKLSGIKHLEGPVLLDTDRAISAFLYLIVNNIPDGVSIPACFLILTFGKLLIWGGVTSHVDAMLAKLSATGQANVEQLAGQNNSVNRMDGMAVRFYNKPHDGITRVRLPTCAAPFVLVDLSVLPSGIFYSIATPPPDELSAAEKAKLGSYRKWATLTADRCMNTLFKSDVDRFKSRSTQTLRFNMIWIAVFNHHIVTFVGNQNIKAFVAQYLKIALFHSSPTNPEMTETYREFISYIGYRIDALTERVDAAEEDIKDIKGQIQANVKETQRVNKKQIVGFRKMAADMQEIDEKYLPLLAIVPFLLVWVGYLYTAVGILVSAYTVLARKHDSLNGKIDSLNGKIDAFRMAVTAKFNNFYTKTFIDNRFAGAARKYGKPKMDALIGSAIRYNDAVLAGKLGRAFQKYVAKKTEPISAGVAENAVGVAKNTEDIRNNTDTTETLKESIDKRFAGAAVKYGKTAQDARINAAAKINNAQLAAKVGRAVAKKTEPIAAGVASNAADIAANATDRSILKAQIESNMVNISSNAAGVASNAADIAANATDRSILKAQVESNMADIAQNTDTTEALTAAVAGAKVDIAGIKAGE